MFRRIQWRITISFATLVLIVMTVLGIYLVNNVRDIQMNYLRNSLNDQATLISQIVSPAFTGDHGEIDLESEITRIVKPVDERITVVDVNGAVLADSEEDISLMENHAVRPEFKAALSGEYGESTRFSTTLGYNMMYVAVPITIDGEVFGAVRASLPLDDVELMTGGVITGVVIALVIAMVLVVISGWIISQLITRPVRELTEASARMASGELHQRISVGTMDETDKLARSFNVMSARLADIVETISQERTRLSSILDNIADGVIMTDGEGIVLTVNKAALSIFRIEGTHIDCKPLIEAIHDHELSEVLKECIETRREQINQFESDHYKSFLRVVAVPVRSERRFAVLLLIQDLTQLRSLQTMRSDLIGNISHDFRTPLAGIKAMVETLQDGAIDDKDHAIDFLNRIEGEVDRLTQMVAELTELSRIETGKAELNIELLDINKLAEETVNQLLPQAERKNITITVIKDDDLPKIHADEERIGQVMINLLHNAIKFTHQDGAIIVATKREDESVTVAISDDGIGINDKDMQHIFERFYMADRSRSGGGSGMGLAIARHVIENHQGTLNVSSREGVGSTFSFSLPVDTGTP